MDIQEFLKRYEAGEKDFTGISLRGVHLWKELSALRSLG